MLRMSFISLPVTNSADGGRRSYPKLSKCNKTASFRPITRWGRAAAALGVSAPPPSGNAAFVGVPPSAPTGQSPTDYIKFNSVRRLQLQFDPTAADRYIEYCSSDNHSCHNYYRLTNIPNLSFFISHRKASFSAPEFQLL